jgi:hypothetical protein
MCTRFESRKAALAVALVQDHVCRNKCWDINVSLCLSLSDVFLHGLQAACTTHTAEGPPKKSHLEGTCTVEVL